MLAHLWKHAEAHGYDEEWVEQQYRLVYPNGDADTEDGDT